jgi:hypothetical protein
VPNAAAHGDVLRPRRLDRALGTPRDPEDPREIIAAYHRAVADVVAGFDGFVTKCMGDGVLVYFSYPRARFLSNELDTVAKGAEHECDGVAQAVVGIPDHQLERQLSMTACDARPDHTSGSGTVKLSGSICSPNYPR